MRKGEEWEDGRQQRSNVNLFLTADEEEKRWSETWERPDFNTPLGGHPLSCGSPCSHRMSVTLRAPAQIQCCTADTGQIKPRRCQLLLVAPDSPARVEGLREVQGEGTTSLPRAGMQPKRLQCPPILANRLPGKQMLLHRQ